MKKTIKEAANTLDGQKAVSAVLGRAQERRSKAMADGDDEKARKHNKTCKDAEDELVDGMLDLTKKGVSQKDISNKQMQGLRHGRKKGLKEGFGLGDIEERANEMIENGYEYGYIEEGDTWDDIMSEGTYSDMYEAAEKLSEEYDINIDEALNYLEKAFNKYSYMYEGKKGKNMKTVKINEDILRKIVKESVKRTIKEAILGDTEPDVNGNKLMSGNQVFEEIDNQIARFGDAHISRFYSDENNVVVAVHKDIYLKCKNEIKGIMKEYSYSFYDAGMNDEYVMMTFKNKPGLTLGENKENVVKLDENAIKQMVAETAKKLLNIK